MMKSLRVENIVGKGEKAGYQHFLLFPQCFPESSSLGLLKVWIVIKYSWSESKAFADNKVNVTRKLKFLYGWVENVVGKGENAGGNKTVPRQGLSRQFPDKIEDSSPTLLKTVPRYIHY